MEEICSRGVLDEGVSTFVLSRVRDTREVTRKAASRLTFGPRFHFQTGLDRDYRYGCTCVALKNDEAAVKPA